jgi:hypothetical protein
VAWKLHGRSCVWFNLRQYSVCRGTEKNRRSCISWSSPRNVEKEIPNTKTERYSSITTTCRSSKYVNEMSWASNAVQVDKKLLIRSVVTQEFIENRK